MCSVERWCRQDHCDMGAKPNPRSRDRLDLQDDQGQTMLRAPEPSRPRLEKNCRPHKEGQDLPA